MFDRPLQITVIDLAAPLFCVCSVLTNSQNPLVNRKETTCADSLNLCLPKQAHVHARECRASQTAQHSTMQCRASALSHCTAQQCSRAARGAPQQNKWWPHGWIGHSFQFLHNTGGWGARAGRGVGVGGPLVPWEAPQTRAEAPWVPKTPSFRALIRPLILAQKPARSLAQNPARSSGHRRGHAPLRQGPHRFRKRRSSDLAPTKNGSPPM
jgi:hypothetical protein